MTTTGPLVVNDPVDILTVTRKIFAASHWTSGSYAGVTTAPMEKTAEEEQPPFKVIGCSVGGLRYAALAPMDHALDETWMYANFVAMGGNPIAGALAEEAAAVYLEAVGYLAQVVNPGAWAAYVGDCGDLELGVWEKIASVEDIVVNWNDSTDYDPDDGPDEETRIAVVDEVVLPAFDEAIALATAAKAAQPDNTTEGS